MAKPNYQGEKRRKDLARKAKKEEKRLRKLQAKESTPSAEAEAEGLVTTEDDVKDEG